MCPRAWVASGLATKPCHWAGIYDSLYILLCAMIQMVTACLWCPTLIGIASPESQMLAVRGVSLPKLNVLNALQRDGHRWSTLRLESLQHTVALNCKSRSRCCSDEFNLKVRLAFRERIPVRRERQVAGGRFLTKDSCMELAHRGSLLLDLVRQHLLS